MPRLGRVLIAALVLGPAVAAAVLELALATRLGAAGSLLLSAGAGALVGLGLCGPAYVAWRRRLRRLARATRALAQGDFDAALPPQLDDDLGELQRVWKRMRVAVEERTQGLSGEVERQRSILEGMAEGVALLDEGQIVEANPAFGRLISAEGSLRGKTPLEAARIPELAEVIDESMHAGSEVVRELAAEPRVLRVAARPIGRGKQQMVVVLLDITEARSVERLRRDFVANASHELRTPVAAILGAAETLAAGAADDAEARASFIDILVRHSQRLTRLTSDLLDLARLEAGYRPRTEIVRVDPVIEAVLLALTTRARDKGVALALGPDHEAAASLEVACERAALEQVLTNLIDNAIKYTPTGGRVQVHARAEGQGVELLVVDTGLGISPEHLPRLFERFYRVDNARSRELGGTGLGLAIVKHLVAANGGEVSVESEPGRGTRFRVRLPRSTPDPKSSQESHSQPFAAR